MSTPDFPRGADFPLRRPPHHPIRCACERCTPANTLPTVAEPRVDEIIAWCAADATIDGAHSYLAVAADRLAELEAENERLRCFVHTALTSIAAERALADELAEALDECLGALTLATGHISDGLLLADSRAHLVDGWLALARHAEARK